MITSILLGYFKLGVRWTHVLAAMYWIGATLFLGKSGRNTVLTPDNPDISGENMAIHGGKPALTQYLRRLTKKHLKIHWFKYQSITTWISGMTLLIMHFWQGWTSVEAFGLMFMATLMYRLLWNQIAPNSGYEWVGVIVSWMGLMGVTWGFSAILQATFLTYYHVGATLATIMAIQNVWCGILPNQRQMVRDLEAGLPINETLQAWTMRYTKHNTYVMPTVVLLMMNTHGSSELWFPGYDWLAIGVISLVGGVVGHLFRKVF